METFEDRLTPAKNVIIHQNTMPETPLQSPGDTSTDRDKQYPRKKRKSSSKTAGIKATLSENNKMIISNLKMAEEGQMKRHENIVICLNGEWRCMRNILTTMQ